MLWILWLLSLAHADSPPTDLRPIAIGEQRVLRAPGLAKYSLSAPCVRVGGQGTTLLIRGLREGTCDLVYEAQGWNKVQFHVYRGTSSGDPALLAALGRLESTETLPFGPKWVLRGRVTTFSEAWRIRKIEEGWPERILNETDLDPILLTEALTRVQQWLRRASLGEDLRVQIQEGQVLITGDAPSNETLLEWVRQARNCFPLVRFQIRSLAEASTPLYLQVYLIAVKKSQSRALGLNWQDGFAESIDLVSKIRALESTGVAQVLSRPEIVVRVPGEAELFAGGELPMEQRNRYISQIQWKGYGLSLKIKALEATGRSVRLEIQTEQSRLDDAVRLKELPAIQSNRLRTLVDAKFEVPILLSGLIQEDRQSRQEGLPGLKDFPLLGLLFGTDSEATDHSELVAILLPHRGTPLIPQPILRRIFPRGPLPWVALRDPDLNLQHSPDYPWNALEP